MLNFGYSIWTLRFSTAMLWFVFSLNHILAQPAIDYADLIVPIAGDFKREYKVPLESQEPLRQLFDITDDELDRLLKSEDSYEIGAGIFVAHNRGDFGRLWELRHLLDDSRATVSMAVLGDASGVERPRQKQVVGSYLSRIYQVWLGFGPASVKHLESTLPNVESPWVLAQPWVVRLWFANEGLSGEEPAKVREQINQLSPDLRWAVVSWCYSSKSKLYNREQALEALQDCADKVAEARTGELKVSSDPFINSEAGKWRLQKLQSVFLDLLSLTEEQQQ